MNIPKYKCHKEVQALKIDGVLKSTKSTVERNGFEARLVFEGREPIDVSFDWVKKHKPATGGYYVEYADGYESFSPAQAFEEGYSLVGEEVGEPDAYTMALNIYLWAKEKVECSNYDQGEISVYVRGSLDTIQSIYGVEKRNEVEEKLNTEELNTISLTNNLASDELSAGKEESNEPEHGPDPQELQPNERPTYQSTSTVSAIRIKTIEYNDDQLTALVTPYETNVEPFTINQAYIHTQHPGEGGYHVITQQGQHLFHTAEWFEKNFQPSAGKIITLVDMSYQEDAENYRQLENEIAEMYEDESNDLVTIGEHVAAHFGFIGMGE